LSGAFSLPALGQAALAATEKTACRQNALIVFEDESRVLLEAAFGP